MQYVLNTACYCEKNFRFSSMEKTPFIDLNQFFHAMSAIIDSEWILSIFNMVFCCCKLKVAMYYIALNIKEIKDNTDN
jgi:hypothetical protein